MKTKIIDGVEYETETHDLGKEFSEIKIPKGWRLWTTEECIKLHNSHRKELNLEACWFFIEQPFALNKENNINAGFVAYSVGAILVCDWGPLDSYSALGVRFAREVKK